MKLALTPIALLMLSLPPSAWSQASSGGLVEGVAALAPTPPDPQTAIIGAELYDYLVAKAGSESALYRVVTGVDLMGNQSVTMLLPNPADVDAGKLVYSGARLQVNSKVYTEPNCTSLTQNTTISESQTVADDASWTAAQSHSSTKSHTISVHVGASAFGASVSSDYSFSTSTTNSTEASTTNGQTQTTQTGWSKALQLPKESVTTFRRDWVTLSAGDSSSIPYTLTPTIVSNAQLVFSVQTYGYNYLGVAEGIFGPGSSSMTALQNLPPVGKAEAAGPVSFPDGGVLWSLDGRFAYGRIENPSKWRGGYGIVDLAYSPSAAQAEVLWWSGGCHGNSIVNTILPYGDVTWNCGSKAVTHTGTYATKNTPCYYLAFSRAYPGTLACYDRDVSQLDAASAENYRHAFAGHARNLKAAPNQSAVSYVQYSVPLATVLQALKQPIGNVTLTFTGTFSGSNVLYYSDCIASIPARVNGNRCNPAKATPNAVCSPTLNYMKTALPGLQYSVQMLGNNFDVAGPN